MQAFTAAQAAQKVLGILRYRGRWFTAAQAAQKTRSSVSP